MTDLSTAHVPYEINLNPKIWSAVKDFEWKVSVWDLYVFHFLLLGF